MQNQYYFDLRKIKSRSSPYNKNLSCLRLMYMDTIRERLRCREVWEVNKILKMGG